MAPATPRQLRYQEDAERMKAMALAAATPEMRAEFLRIASMYEVLGSRVGPTGTLNPPERTAPVSARE